MIEDEIELSHLINEYDHATDEDKKEYREYVREQLKFLTKLYLHQNKDELGIFTVVAEQIGFKSYNCQSLFGEEVIHYINNNDELITVIYNPMPDVENIQAIKEGC